MIECLSKKRFDFIEILVLSSYFLFLCFLFLGLFGYFNRVAVFIVVGLLAVFLFLFRKKIVFKKEYAFVFLLTIIVGVGFGLLRGFFTGDVYQLWLPAARDLARSGYFPGFELAYYFPRMPLLSMFFAATFSFFKSFNEFLCLWVPFLFTGSTLILLLKWGRDKGLDKKWLYFIPILFLTNVLLEFFGSWNLMQESLILFFATSFFYFYESYNNAGNKKDFILMILSLVLAAASKISGLFLFLFVPFIFFKSKEKDKVLSYLFSFSVPVLIWLARNYFVFGNPIFPILETMFKGKYYAACQIHALFHILPSYLISFQNKAIWVTKQLGIAFPFIFLSVYAFVKNKKWDYLIVLGAYFLAKETFLFTPTDSAARYYYLFLGLLIIYAFCGLKELKSKFALTALASLSFGGLLLLPIVKSSSSFIGSLENKFSFFYYIFNFLHNYWFIVFIPLIFVFYFIADNEKFKFYLLFTYSLYILHLRFIANKSWLNTWPFVLAALLLPLILLIKPKIKHFCKIIIVIIILGVFANSWAMAAVYHLRQEKIVLPVEYLWQESKWAHTVLDKEVSIDKRGDFYIIINAQTGYFLWWTDYKSITLFSRPFWVSLGDFDNEWSDRQMTDFFVKNKVKYVIFNEEISGFYPKEYEKFFEKVANSPYFNLIAQKDNKYAVWQIY